MLGLYGVGDVPMLAAFYASAVQLPMGWLCADIAGEYLQSPITLTVWTHGLAPNFLSPHQNMNEHQPAPTGEAEREKR